VPIKTPQCAAPAAETESIRGLFEIPRPEATVADTPADRSDPAQISEALESVMGRF
jgi:hypothetical protein